jgi:MinD superfamily P-loop ATPase
MSKHFILAGHVKGCKLEDIEEDVPPQRQDKKYCIYSGKCHKTCEYDTVCRIRDFYTCFPEYDGELGIGAKI